jgi:hypothetical protein
VLELRQHVYSTSLDLVLPELRANVRSGSDEAGLKWLLQDAARLRAAKNLRIAPDEIEGILTDILRRSSSRAN